MPYRTRRAFLPTCWVGSCRQGDLGDGVLTTQARREPTPTYGATPSFVGHAYRFLDGAQDGAQVFYYFRYVNININVSV